MLASAARALCFMLNFPQEIRSPPILIPEMTPMTFTYVYEAVFDGQLVRQTKEGGDRTIVATK